MKFAAVQLLKQRAGRAHAEAAPARAAAAGAARRGAAAAGAGLRASVLRRPARRSAIVRRSTIVALDTSFSMSAPGTFERAKQLAKDAIGSVPAGDLVGVVTFADAAEIVAKPSADRALAAAADRRRAAGLRRHALPRGALAPRSQQLGGRQRARSSSSPTCRRAAGTPATARRCPKGRRSRSPTSGAPPPNLAVTSRAAAAGSGRRHGPQRRRRARATRACS